MRNILKCLFFLAIILISFTSCNAVKSLTGSEDFPSFVKDVAKKTSTDHKNISGSNDFNSLVKILVDDMSLKLKKYVMEDDIVLVSDFVNLDRLENRSKLGFLLSENLKDSLINKDIIVRQVELSENFTYGQHGLNLLTREQKEIVNKNVKEKFAVVGTYTITTQSLIVFIKLLDVTNGNILAAANSSTSVDEEITQLEGMNKERKLTFRPRMVL
ncbi:FlgO family outer membrane protein [Halarcobacter mediterraneus]|uniref:FlgO family outer membrane protein n=1 Tax=Halarcobacter mediterraneus TaxID=2023153 RepID=UPI0013E99C7F|nr:FlgO family outer membrane protein [Halarcobacter mediterraneus]